MFRGLSSINLDEKGRLALPTRYRAEIADCCDRQLVMTAGLGEYLLLYPMPEFEEIERKLVSLPALNKQAQRLQRLIIGHATECEMDGQGRILVSEPLRRFANLDRRIALVGQGKKFELWDEETWNGKRPVWIEEERAVRDQELSPELSTLSL